MFDTSVAGSALSTWGYNGALNGPVIRAKTGDTLDVLVTNTLAESTSVHWHGLALRNDADGVLVVSQPAIKPGANFDYQFRLNQPGTYWYHSHVDMQRERGLSGALIIEDPREPLLYAPARTQLPTDQQRRMQRHVIVRPKEKVTFEFDADNPGQWIAHCHNAYHADRGMIGLFSRTCVSVATPTPVVESI
ncbi:multicopper oxidase domain-containing protein [Cryobacterium serini]|uniref:multicopper oxidase domain-containing protein n=1 Tax=Cryobacterium serini TaxID=1259201 RepID=UPI00141BEFA7|nr:multicopper oxidase domain-containing protein [Cryobacterium serini]